MTGVHKAECRLGDYQFSDRFFDKNVYFYVLSMKDSFLLWVGESPPKLRHLAVGMETNCDKMPSSSVLIGDPLDVTSSTLAQKLAKKTQKQVFISYNLPTTDLQLLALVEKRVLTELKAFPDKFWH